MKKILVSVLIVLMLIVLKFFINIYDNNNLDSDDFYIEEYGNNKCLTLTKNSTLHYKLYLCGVITSNYNGEYILIVRKDAEHFNCVQGNSKLIKKRLQYMIVNKSSKEILVTNSQEKFNLKLQKLNIDLQLQKTDEELNKILNSIRPKNISTYDDCTRVSNYPLTEL